MMTETGGGTSGGCSEEVVRIVELRQGKGVCHRK